LFLYLLFNDPPPPEIYTLSLHDALPISNSQIRGLRSRLAFARTCGTNDVQGRCRGPRSEPLRWLLIHRPSPAELLLADHDPGPRDRKSTRLNSSHDQISYAVFCLKKKKK